MLAAAFGLSSPVPRRLRFAFEQEPKGKFAAAFRDGDNKEKDEETPCGKLNSSQLDRTKAMHILENALEIERLALVALQLIDPKPGNGEDLEKEFRLALPKAYRLLQLTKEFLDEKEEMENPGREKEVRGDAGGGQEAA
jgi:hypothetical protein